MQDRQRSYFSRVISVLEVARAIIGGYGTHRSKALCVTSKSSEDGAAEPLHLPWTFAPDNYQAEPRAAHP